MRSSSQARDTGEESDSRIRDLCVCARCVMYVRAVDAGYVQSVRCDVTVYDSLSLICNVKVSASFAASSGTNAPLESAVFTHYRLRPSYSFFLRRSCSFAAELRTSFVFCRGKQRLMLRRQETHSCCPSLRIAVDYMSTK